MKTYIRIIIMCLLALPFAARAQVSIGTLSPIEPAALLQLGDYVAKNQGDTTSVSGGLLLPRIVLTDLNKVTVIPESSSSDKKIDLTGLLVYNIGTGNGISEGLYEWDGYKWLPLESESQTVGSNT
ncbi:MAG: hypothetical protein LBS54_06960, partial [Dysgonamonadaceae bacterium]|nr:hypothetical protein [Dysgonamonadaceae bacterium]